MGAAATPGHAALAELTGRTVILWPDADDVGRAHMDRVGAGLAGIAADVRRIDWADAPDHGDAADYLAAATDPEALINAARPVTRQGGGRTDLAAAGGSRLGRPVGARGTEYVEDLVRPGRIIVWAAEEGSGKSLRGR